MASFYDQNKEVVWAIEIEYDSKRKTLKGNATGFAIPGNKILTSAHTFKGRKVLRIMARSLEEKDFTHEMTLVCSNPALDIVMLKFTKDTVDVSFGNLAHNGTIDVGERLYHIGHPLDFIGSFLTAHAVYACVDGVNIDFNASDTCLNYHSKALQVTPLYRVMGDIWNKGTVSDLTHQMVYEKQLNPHGQIIQSLGFRCAEGCSGGPVFKTNGDIVGMLAMGIGGYDIAIHVSTLKVFLDGVSNNDEPSAKKPKLSTSH